MQTSLVLENRVVVAWGWGRKEANSSRKERFYKEVFVNMFIILVAVNSQMNTSVKNYPILYCKYVHYFNVSHT